MYGNLCDPCSGCSNCMPIVKQKPPKKRKDGKNPYHIPVILDMSNKKEKNNGRQNTKH